MKTQWCYSVLYSVLFILICTSCATNKASIVQSYEEALRLPDLILAIPRGPDSKPVWIQALVTTTSATWCEKGKRVRLPDGNDWKNPNGFLCFDNTNDKLVFQDIKRKNPGWKFRWGCTAKESACLVKK